MSTTHATELFAVATYDRGTFTGFLKDRDRTSWTLSTAVRKARQFTEAHPGTTATVKAYWTE